MYGLGLRPPFYAEAMRGEVPVDFFEVTTENFMVEGGRPLKVLDAVRSRYPVSLHGVSMNLGGTDPLDTDYLNRLQTLIRRSEPRWISDHLCWTGVSHHNLHDLMPLPYTEEAVRHVAARVREVQDFLKRRILLENVSSYVSYLHSSMQEWEFLTTVAEQADCLILLDVNNIYVSSRNHNLDPAAFLQGVPNKRVAQIHLAGHSHNGKLIIDTHDHPVSDPVWNLYTEAVSRFGRVSTIIERDDNIPPLGELVAELDKARAMALLLEGQAA